MSTAKLSLACGLAAVSLCGCGIAAKPLAGTPKLISKPGNHAKVDDPRAKHLGCMVRGDLPARAFTTANGLPGIQVGALPAGPTIVFQSTPGVAQGFQINGKAQRAEVIGSAQLYPNLAPDKELSTIEQCLALGVTG
ncbi:MAG: hypothetical protein ACLP0J_12205 [Solirubrobacteraceae bacterium]|jgi:hypothetical protein